MNETRETWIEIKFGDFYGVAKNNNKIGAQWKWSFDVILGLPNLTLQLMNELLV